MDPKFYEGINSVTIQRWISDGHKRLVDNLLKPVTDRQHAWLVYEIDDMMSDKYIPLYNRGRKAFEGEHIQSNIKSMLDSADIITVTTDYIKDSYSKTYGIPKDKIVAMPNLLPRYLFGDRFDIQKKVNQFKQFKNKPRIGIVSSLSHYNIDDVRSTKDGKACRKETVTTEGGEKVTKWFDENHNDISENDTQPILDDMDIIIDTIRETVDDVQWVFFGYAPPKLQDLIQKRKIEVHGGVVIMNYPSTFDNLNLQAVIAPIQDTEFNRCKSFIKYMECASLGVPLFAQDCIPYNRVMPSNQLFKDGKDLKEKLLKFKFQSVGSFEKTVMYQWTWLNSPNKEGDFNINNFWMEDNLNIYLDLFRLRQKCIDCSLDVYLKIKAKKEEEKKQKTIFSDDNGVEILR